ncbi:MAG: RNA polymerase sigma factor [Planctomycetota bacterium]|jgi:RNA polymerase sigma-70 factor (ECF subfamily)
MSEPQRTDEELIAAFQDSGDPRMLSGVIRRHVEKVRTMISQMVAGNADVDDLTQDVFVRAIRGIAEFRGESQFSTWLYRIAMNTTYSFLRKQSRPQPAGEEVLADQADRRASTPERLAMAGELNGAITAAVGSLTPTLRAAVVLTTLQGLGVREASKIEGCATATMYWRIHKARKILKKELEKHLT